LKTALGAEMAVHDPKNSRYPMDYLDTIDTETYEQARTLRGFCLYHSKEWHEVLTRTFGWRVGCLIQRNELGKIELLIPIVRKRDLTGRLSDVSLPLSNYVPPLSASSGPILVESPQLRLRIHSLISGKGIVFDTSRVRTLLDLTRFSSEEELYASLRLHTNDIQRRINIAKRGGYRLATADQPGTLAEFNRLQAVTRRRQGSPTYPMKFFDHMSEVLGARFRLHVVERDKQIVAGVAFLYDSKRAIYGYGASTTDPAILRDGVNQLAMWGALRQAFLDGKELVDFGTSTKTMVSLIYYKEKWGGKTIDCPYSILAPRGKQCGSVGINRDSKSARAAAHVIRHMPLSAFRLLSPLLLKLVA
jgi:Acetyltransferase (GNAT) domain